MYIFAKNFLLGVCYIARTLVVRLFPITEVGILCYHSISDSATSTAVSPVLFEQHLRALKKDGYSFVTLAAVAAWQRGEGVLPQKAVALTFDDGPVDFKDRALPLLETYAAPAALFVAGDTSRGSEMFGNTVPVLSAEEVALVAGHPLVTIGYHSLTHRNMAKLTREELVIESEPRFSARFFAYPGGNHTQEAREVVKAAGYTAACGIGRGLVARGGDPFLLPRTVVTQGMSSWQVVSLVGMAGVWYQRIVHLYK